MSTAADWVTFLSMTRARAVVQAFRAHPFASDAVLAFGLAALVLSEVLTSRDYLSGSNWVYVPVALLMTVPLAWRRRTPLAAVAVVMGAFAAQSLILDRTPDIELIPALIAVYSVAAHGEGWTAFAGGAYGLVAGVIWLGIGDFLLPVVIFGGAWFAGRLVRKRQLFAQVFAERARVLERERDANARLAAAEERVRIARELHDAVGHSVSVMVVQAGAERMALGSGKPVTAEALEAIEKTGRQALTEMRRLLGMLRVSDEPPAHAPQPTLAELDELLAQVRDAGVPVELHIEGRQVALPPGIAVSAYRIVQEALTNVLKHAGPAHARVIVRYESRELELEIADDGQGPREASDAGHALVGMRERVALYDGELDAGARNGGGFVVRARLPLAATQE